MAELRASTRSSRQEGAAPQDQSQLSRGDFVYQRLRRGIRSGEFKPGDRMREADLATRLNVSRTPIREAIRRLESDGLVEVAPSRGVMIIQLDKQQVRELYALREALEGTAARLAAHHASDDEILELRHIADAMAAETVPETIARVNTAFHQTIHDAAHNRYLVQALVHLSDSLALLPGTTFEVPERVTRARVEHLAVVEAIAARDGDEADRIARHHIRLAGKARLRLMFERA